MVVFHKKNYQPEISSKILSWYLAALVWSNQAKEYFRVVKNASKILLQNFKHRGFATVYLIA